MEQIRDNASSLDSLVLLPENPINTGNNIQVSGFM